MLWRQRSIDSVLAAASLGMCLVVLGGTSCPLSLPVDDATPLYPNTTDPTNDGADYIGSSACIACHQTRDPDLVASFAIHGHGHKLTMVNGTAPSFPPEATRAGVPNPPTGFAYADLAYVIGGYIRKGRFVNADGYILTNDADAVDTQWNLDYPPNGTVTGFAPYENGGNFSPANPKPYDFSCFTCHTTGAREQDAADPRFQDNRPGMAGTFEETGVQCEACHGPGSKHPPRLFERNLYVGLDASACGGCHTRGDDPNVIQASGGYINHHEQWPELLASGGHATFGCTDCHDPHVSTNYERDNAMQKTCSSSGCHPTQDLGHHEGKVFTRGDYTETLACESCHMPFATKSATAATAAVVGANGRMGDMRTHIFRIDPERVDFADMFSADGSTVVKDASGRAAVSLDFVCLRCHNGIGSAFHLTKSLATDLALSMHKGTD